MLKKDVTKNILLTISIFLNIAAIAQTCTISSGTVNVSNLNTTCGTFTKLIVTGSSTLLDINAAYTNSNIVEVSIENGATMNWSTNNAFTIGASGSLFLNKNGGGTISANNPCNTNKDFFIGTTEISNCSGSTGVASFADVNAAGGATSSGPLPVELMSFLAIIDGFKASVQWVTASEYNSNHFRLYHSSNGTVYTFVNKQPAAGQSSSIINYSASFKNITEGKNYFKLVQTDFDGDSSVYFTHARVDRLNGVSVYPTPFSSNIKVNITDVLDPSLNISLVSIIGEKYFELNKVEDDIVIIDTKHVPSGIYFLNINDRVTKVVKF